MAKKKCKCTCKSGRQEEWLKKASKEEKSKAREEFLTALGFSKEEIKERMK